MFERSASSKALRPAARNRRGKVLRGVLSALIPGAFALTLATGPAQATSTQLSAGHPFSDVDFNPAPPRLSPNGAYAVYSQDAVTDGASELWSVALPDGEPVRLSDVLAAGQRTNFAISPDGTRVVYTVDQDTPGVTELYSVPIAGGVRSKLNPNLAAGRNVIGFLISPTSDRVFYLADRNSDNKFELFSVPIAGGLVAKLNEELSSDFDVEAFRASPDGQWVVYRAGRTAIGLWELWSVPAVGGEAVKLSGLLNPGGAADAYYLISPDSSRVVYRADATEDESYDLFSVPIGGGTATALNAALPAGGSVDTGFLISANGTRVVYRADQALLQVFELWSVPIGGGISIRMNGPLAGGEDVGTGFLISPNGTRVVYRADQESDTVDELWSVAIQGGTPVRLNGPLVAGGDVLEHAISPNSARVVYRADQSVDTLNELWSVPIAGGTATRLNRTLAAGGDVQAFQISPDSAWVVYGADQDVDLVDELLRAPIAGGTVENVSGPLAPGGDVALKYVQTTVFEISPANSYDVLYAADERANDEIELFLSGEPYEDAPDACIPDAETLCLLNDKFNVTVTWRDFQDRTGSGRATQLSNESGDFWFFNAQSNELIIKIIDACASTGNYWVFWRALSNVEIDLVIRNTTTLQTLTYLNPLGYNSNGHLDIDTIFRCDGSGPPTETIDTATALPAPGVPELIERVDPQLIAPCVPNSDRVICLQGGRFRVEGTWSDFAGGSGYAHLIKKNEGSGYAWFFNGNNYEMLFKLVDACSYNGNTWVSIAGLTNVAASLTITDTWTGAVYSQQNALGVDFPTNLDIETNLTYCGASPF